MFHNYIIQYLISKHICLYLQGITALGSKFLTRFLYLEYPKTRRYEDLETYNGDAFNNDLKNICILIQV